MSGQLNFVNGIAGSAKGTMPMATQPIPTPLQSLPDQPHRVREADRAQLPQSLLVPACHACVASPRPFAVMYALRA